MHWWRDIHRGKTILCHTVRSCLPRAGLDAFWNRSVAASVARRTKNPLLLIPLSE